MKITLAFDVYGTLVDPSGMAKHVADDLGSEAASFADFWREKQLEYSFRRGLMQNYADFSICTSDALNFTCRRFKVSISSERRAELLGLYQHLPRLDDVTPALQSLQTAFRLFAFSNGKRSQIDAVLSNADILVYFEGLVSADDVRSFKPSPAVYSYARRVTGAWSSPFWLISSNPWDVIGARSAGLSSAWVQRSDEKIYDPWGIEPDITVRSLIDLPMALGDGGDASENPVNDRTFFKPGYSYPNWKGIRMITYNYAEVNGQEMFYREAGDKSAPTIVLLHGFPTSSHMYRNLIPQLADTFHVIAPDYIGFGYSDAPNVREFSYTFDNLATHVEKLLFGVLGLKRFSIYVQDYGAPVGYRIASKNREAIEGIVVQNGNAYVAGIGGAFDPMKPFWANRNAETEKPVRGLLTLETTAFQYTHGAKNPKRISSDNWTFDQTFLDRPGNDAIQLDLLHNYSSNVALYDGWHEYFRTSQPRMLIVWGKNDPFFTVEGAKAYQRDLPKAELHLLDTGHFALEEEGDFIAERIKAFLR